jgi:hypothetical protein
MQSYRKSEGAKIMAKKNTPMAEFQARLRNNIAIAHPVDEQQPEPVSPNIESSEKATPAPVQNMPPVGVPTPPPAVVPKAKRRRVSQWINRYPDATPFQTTVYLTDEDLALIKSLRLKLKFSRDWQVLKYALERLAKEVDRGAEKP